MPIFTFATRGRTTAGCVFAFSLVCGVAQAQLASSAYRVLGQPDLRQNGTNMVAGVELHNPNGLALDSRDGQIHLYISDTMNSRVLAWQDVASYGLGDPPALVLGQPGPQYTRPLGIGAKGFNAPLGLAVDPRTGDLFVADFGNNRILRFPAPFANLTRVEPDAVYGQPNFTTASSRISSSALYQPRAVACDSAGNLWVADSGNNRILRFGVATLNSVTPPEADVVIGQPDFVSGAANRGDSVSASGLYTPAGLVFDAQGNLYVADFNNTRVLKFSGPLGPSSTSAAATAVWGQSSFTVRGVPVQATNSSLAGPVGLSLDSSGHLYVAVPNDNRLLVFPTDKSATAADSVLGQSTSTSTTSNATVFPLASAATVSGPSDVKVDPSGNVLVADSGNNRVILFPQGSKSATRVWGQSDFTCNGVNQIKPGSINLPYRIAIDYSRAPFALYVSDLNNNRVLGWKDAVAFRNGAAADLVIGQPDFRTAAANLDTQGSETPSKTSLSGPAGLAVDPATGALYVADSGNNRILRYPRPFDQGGRITPDLVIGQPSFTSSSSSLVNASSLKAPAGLAIGPNGDLFVADTGNNRVLQFAAGTGNGAAAIRVYGQAQMNASIKPSQVSPQTLLLPQGIVVDQAYTLYVADTGANRVLIYPNTQMSPSSGVAAGYVIGQSSLSSTSGGGSGASLRSPTDVALDSGGKIYVADGGDNRVLIFPSLISLPVSGGAASGVVGQRDLGSTTANWNSSDGLATPEGLYGPASVYVDRQDTLYVGDAGNNRVLHFLKAAAIVNAATFQANVPVAPGGLATLFGAGLASDTQSAVNVPWPMALGNRQVLFDDEAVAPLFYLGDGQTSFQVPWSLQPGAHRAAVRIADTGELIAGGGVSVASVSPGLFNAGGQAAAVNQDGTLNGPSHPAPKGSIITFYGTGQGQVSDTVPDGAAPSGLVRTVAVPTSDGKTCLTSQPSMCIAIGSTFGDVQFSGLMPSYVGVWQINVKIPQEALTGNAVPVRAVINGMPSNTVTIAIK
jgi:uncharacterized protein (TIGR03437 family)